MRGTATSTETCSRWIVAITSVGLNVFSKTTRAPKQRRKKYSQKLPEDVAQWKQVQKTNRMYQPLVLEIFLDLSLDGDQVADHVGMRDHDALGLRRRTGSENNFERIGRLNFDGTVAL